MGKCQGKEIRQTSISHYPPPPIKYSLMFLFTDFVGQQHQTQRNPLCWEGGHTFRAKRLLHGSNHDAMMHHHLVHTTVGWALGGLFFFNATFNILNDSGARKPPYAITSLFFVFVGVPVR